jgi:ABC-type nickel/cobalt efflux system permease component RcnA
LCYLARRSTRNSIDGMAMAKDVEFWLAVIALLLVLILFELSGIARRLRRQFPTEKEQDYNFSQADPMGHWEAHKRDKGS